MAIAMVGGSRRMAMANISVGATLGGGSEGEGRRAWQHQLDKSLTEGDWRQCCQLQPREVGQVTDRGRLVAVLPIATKGHAGVVALRRW